MALDQATPVAAYWVVLTTCASDDDARMLALTLLDRRLAACIQVVDIRSSYTWRGETAEEPEKLLLIKTRAALYEQVEAALRAVHPYETPEVVCLPLVAGAAPYLGWIDAVTTAPGQ
jgi:periplasmic divalent cation tolerance protein